MANKSDVKVKFRQSGGVAGLLKGCDLDSSVLSQADAEELRKLLAEGLPIPDASSENLRDAAEYELAVTIDGQSKNYRFATGTVAERVKPLLKFLRQRSTPQKID